MTAFARDRDGTVWAGSFPPKGRSGLWRFDGSAWQNVAADFGMPAEPVASLGFDRDGRLWILVGGRGSQGPKQLYFLPPGEKRVQKAGENLLVDYFTLDADQHVLTSPEPRPGEPGSRVQAALPAYPILRAASDQIVDRANAVWVFAKGLPLLHRQGEAPLADLVADASPSNSDAFAINFRGGAHLVDREGSVWIGADSGVHRFSYSPLARVKLPDRPAPFFMLVPDDNGAVWISASNGNGSSSLYHVAGTTVDAQQSLPGTYAFAYRAPDRSLWFGGEEGLWHRVGDGVDEGRAAGGDRRQPAAPGRHDRRQRGRLLGVVRPGRLLSAPGRRLDEIQVTARPAAGNRASRPVRRRASCMRPPIRSAVSGWAASATR